MKFTIVSPDPFHVLSSTKHVVESARFVSFNDKKIAGAGQMVSDKLQQVSLGSEMRFGECEAPEDNAQLIFLEDAANFCFWAEKGKDKWRVEWPQGQIEDGWFALTACFQRALARKVPILNADYLMSLTLPQTEAIFADSNGVEIPLIAKRRENLAEAGKVLQEKYDGKVINLLEEADFDAIKIVKQIFENFSSYKDVAVLDGREIYFQKRVQLVVQDFSYIQGLKIKNIEVLTGFADYKVPQILRELGITVYSPELAGKVDNYIPVPAGSRDEIEIRSATVWGVELIKQKLSGKHTAPEIDNALWLINQNQKQFKPYHRTYTIYY